MTHHTAEPRTPWSGIATALADALEDAMENVPDYAKKLHARAGDALASYAKAYEDPGVTVEVTLGSEDAEWVIGAIADILPDDESGPLGQLYRALESALGIAGFDGTETEAE